MAAVSAKVACLSSRCGGVSGRSRTNSRVRSAGTVRGGDTPTSRERSAGSGEPRIRSKVAVEEALDERRGQHGRVLRVRGAGGEHGGCTGVQLPVTGVEEAVVRA